MAIFFKKALYVADIDLSLNILWNSFRSNEEGKHLNSTYCFFRLAKLNELSGGVINLILINKCNQYQEARINSELKSS